MTGRPSKYSEKLADEICARLAEGQSVRTVCRDENMPCMSTIFKWLREKEQFSQQYVRAKQEAADALAEEMLDIADDATNDWMERLGSDGQPLGYQLNGEHVQRSKLRVDTRKWLASKLKPKTYGDRQQVENFTYEVTPEDRLSAAHYGLSPTEYVQRRESGTLPDAPPLPELH